MKTLKITAIMAAMAVFTFTSCKKNDTGGDVTIVAFPKHHADPIFGATAYVSFKEKDQPSDPTGSYDLKIEGEANEDHVHIESLRAGDYYIYLTGYDSTEAVNVSGGTHVKIKWKERKTPEIDVDIAVAE